MSDTIPTSMEDQPLSVQYMWLRMEFTSMKRHGELREAKISDLTKRVEELEHAALKAEGAKEGRAEIERELSVATDRPRFVLRRRDIATGGVGGIGVGGLVWAFIQWILPLLQN